MQEKYDKIGVGYNRTRKADPYLLARFYHHLQPSSDKKYLDIGCGTGNYTIALQAKGVHLLGIDPSTEMLQKAQEKNQDIIWKIGKAEAIPANDEEFNGATASLTIHHWNDVGAGFKELSRVLKSNSRVVIFTSTPEQMKQYWLMHYFPQMLHKSLDQMPSYELVEEKLHAAGFDIIDSEKYFVTNELQDLFLQSGKYNPSLYFDETVRKGISSFAALSNADEVAAGLEKLEKDIQGNKIQEIIDRYESNEGDYLFIIAQKR